LLSYDEKTEILVGEIVNVSVDEKILDNDGNIDFSKFQPITLDPIGGAYRKIGEKVADAFSVGASLRK
jgi:flavin reductase (DIM6/NTAB) family NADH-FMN oxidoreductase RutF